MSDEFSSVTSQVWQERLAQIMETMRELSLQTDPQAMVREYYDRMRQVNPQIDRRLAMSRRGLEYPQFRITRYSEWEDDINPWTEQERLPLLSGGILAELIYANEPRIINELMVAADDPGYPYLAEQKSLQAIPLLDQGQSLNMSLHTRRVPNGFSYERLGEAVWLANLFGRATSNLVLAEQLKAAYQTIDNELKAVARIQRSLLPAHLPEIPRLTLATYYQTAQRTGGDYYDFFPLANDCWGILIADVSGHGTPAAVLMAVAHSIAHTFTDRTASPRPMLKYLNERLCQHYVGHTGTFVTAFYAVFDPSTLRLTYSSAGHNPPRRRLGCDGTVENLDQAQVLPLGVTFPWEPIEATIKLHPGDQLVLYTDGIVESRNAEHELFGTSRLDQILKEPHGGPQGVIDQIVAAVTRHCDGRAAADDETLVVCQIG